MHSSWNHYWIAMAVLVIAAPLPPLLGRNDPAPLQRPLTDLSYAAGRWRGADEPLSDRVREKLGTDDILMRRYVNARGDIVWLYVSFFERQQQGEISHSPKNCLPGAGWQPLESKRISYPVPDRDAGMINEVIFDKDGQRQLVYYWFQERGRVVASEYAVKLYLIWDVITRHRTDGALLRVSAPIHDSEEATREQLQEFMRVALPQLNEFLPQ